MNNIFDTLDDYALTQLQRRYGPPVEHGLAGEFVAGLKRGTMQVLPERVGKAAGFLGGEDIEQGIENYVEQSKLEHPEWEPSPGVMERPWYSPRKAIAAAGEMIPASAGVPLVIGGAVSTLPVSGTVAATAGALGSAGLFGLAQARETEQMALKAGKSPEEASSLAWKTGTIEAVGEGIADFVPLKWLFGPTLKGVGKEAAGSLVKQILSPNWKQTAKKALTVLGTEEGTELFQAGTQQYLHEKHGITPKGHIGEAMADVVLPTAILSSFFIMGGHFGDARNRKRISNALSDPSVAAEQRQAAVQQVAEAMKDADPDMAATWLKSATTAIDKGLPIPVDSDDVTSITSINQQVKEPEVEAKPSHKDHLTKKGKPFKTKDGALMKIAQLKAQGKNVFETPIEVEGGWKVEEILAPAKQAPKTNVSMEAEKLAMRRELGLQPGSPRSGAINLTEEVMPNAVQGRQEKGRQEEIRQAQPRTERVGTEKAGPVQEQALAAKEAEQTKIETEVPLGKRIIDEVKQPVDLAEMATRKGKKEVAAKMAEKAIKNGEAIKLADGPATEQLINEQLDRLPEELKGGKRTAPERTTTAEEAQAEPTTPVEVSIPKKIGDSQKIANIDAILANTKRVNGIDYELYNANKLKDKRGIVRIFDADSGETVTVRVYRTFDEAELAYNDALRVEGIEAPKKEPLTEIQTASTPVEAGRALQEAEVEKVKAQEAEEPVAEVPKIEKAKEPWIMTQDEWNNATRFYRSGKTKNAQLPTGERVILKKESTAANYKETSGDFLRTLRGNTVKQALEQNKPIPREVLEDYKSEEWAKKALGEPELVITEQGKTVSDTKVRLIDKVKSERGSFSTKPISGPTVLEDLVTIGKDIINRGADTYQKFATQLKQALGDVWANIKHLAMSAYAKAKQILKSERGSFGGMLAKTANRYALGTAKKMEANGVDAETIRKKTGWFKGMDDKWRFEISDEVAKFLDSWDAIHGGIDRVYPLPTIFKHNEFFDAYPEFRSIGVQKRKLSAGTRGEYIPADRILLLDSDITEEQAKATILHEIQHMIQHAEGFAMGGRPSDMDIMNSRFLVNGEDLTGHPIEYPLRDDMPQGYVKDSIGKITLKPETKKKYAQAWTKLIKDLERKIPRLKRKSTIEQDKLILSDFKKSLMLLQSNNTFKVTIKNSLYSQYARLAGEIEAKDVSERRKLTVQQRKEQQPYTSQGIPKEKAIIRFGHGRMYSETISGESVVNEVKPAPINNPKLTGSSSNVFSKIRAKQAAKDKAHNLTPTNRQAERSPDTTFLNRVVNSPEFYSEKVKGFNEVVRSKLERTDNYYQTLSDLTEAKDGTKHVTLMADLEKQRKTEYARLGKLIVSADQTKTNHTPEALKKQGFSDQAVKAWQSFRQVMDNGLDLLTKRIIELRYKAKKAGKKLPKITIVTDEGRIEVDLDVALADMGKLKGNYAPRIREPKRLVLFAKKEGTNPRREHFDTMYSLRKRARELAKDGYKCEWEESLKLPEDVFLLYGQPVAIEAVINEAIAQLQKTGDIDSDALAKFSDALAVEVANIIKGRGARKHMLARREEIWEGYETDPKTMMVRYSTNLAAAEAKRKSAIAMAEAARTIDKVSNPNAYHDAMHYMNEMLRNQDASDRLMGTIKAITALKYLGFKVSSPLINLTALAQTVPPSMNAYAKIPLGKTFGLIVKGAQEFRSYRKGNIAGMDKGLVAFFDEMHKKGWDRPQYSRELLREAKTSYGKGWDKFLDWSMSMFAWTEQLNRMATMAGTYIGLKQQQGLKFNHEQAMALAKKVSDKAHGVYDKGTLPYWAQGQGLGGKAGQAFYMFSKYPHTFLQNLYDIGWNQKNYKAAAYMMLAPTILAGAAGFPGWDLVKGILNKVLDSDDIEEDFYAWLEDNVGEMGSDFARDGIFGLAGSGISLKGSLSTELLPPTDLVSFLGAPGSLGKDIYYAGKDLMRGNAWKAAEKVIVPQAAGNILKAIREEREGVTNTLNAPEFRGMNQIQPDALDTAFRFFSFNPAHIAKQKAQNWSDKKISQWYADEKTAIYAQFKKLYGQGRNASQADYVDALKAVEEFNATVRRRGKTGIVSPITQKSIRQSIKQAFTPSKKDKFQAKRVR